MCCIYKGHIFLQYKMILIPFSHMCMQRSHAQHVFVSLAYCSMAKSTVRIHIHKLGFVIYRVVVVYLFTKQRFVKIWALESGSQGNAFLMQKLCFVPINLHCCWPVVSENALLLVYLLEHQKFFYTRKFAWNHLQLVCHDFVFLFEGGLIGFYNSDSFQLQTTRALRS